MIRLTKDVSNGIEQTVTVTSPEAGGEAVKVFLKDVVEAGARKERGDDGAPEATPK